MKWWIRDGQESDDEKRDAHIVLTVDEMLEQGANFFTCYAFYRYQFNMTTMQLLKVAKRYSDEFPWLFDFLKSEIAKVENEIRADDLNWMLDEPKIYDYAN
jgi:hypothetical protein